VILEWVLLLKRFYGYKDIVSLDSSFVKELGLFVKFDDLAKKSFLPK